MLRIAPGLYTLTGLTVGRVYLIVDPDGLTLIDAGLPGAARRALRQITAAGYQAGDVKRILITHAHADHAGGLSQLKAASGAQVWASAAERPAIEGGAPIPMPSRTGLLAQLKLPSAGARREGAPPGARYLEGAPVDRVLAHGEALPEVMGGLQVIATPGHTPGHLAYWQAERRVLFCGDLIMHLLGFRQPFAMATIDAEQNRRSIRRVLELEPALVCFGHGLPLARDATAALKAWARP